MSNYEDKETKKAIVKDDSSIHNRSRAFLATVEKEFKIQIGRETELTEYQKMLAKNLFIGLNNTLQKLEQNRQEKNPNRTPITWNNIVLDELYINAVHIVNLGLDAMMPNHVHGVPYWDNRAGKYRLNLIEGYKGKDYYMRKAAIDEPIDIRYELVYSNDKFTPIFKDADNRVESYKFQPAENPFNRGKIIGGFGYIIYSDDTKNKLVLIKPEEFDKWDKGVFWQNNPEKMRLKTIVHRTTSELTLDPKKVHTLSMAAVNQNDYAELENQEKKVQGSTEFDDFEDVSETEPESREPENYAGNVSQNGQGATSASAREKEDEKTSTNKGSDAKGLETGSNKKQSKVDAFAGIKKGF